MMKSISPRNKSPLIELDGYDSLVELALDLRWSWNHGTDVIWNRLDPVLWDLTRKSVGHPRNGVTRKTAIVLIRSGLSPAGG
jgi:hypothetical protein